MSAAARDASELKSLSERLRAICLALPEAREVVIKRGPTYRIDDKIFALDRLAEGRPSAWFKAPLLAALLRLEGLGRHVA
jgi:hypothetical protein